jgi:DNA-binding transcriptional ArsR family regulator
VNRDEKIEAALKEFRDCIPLLSVLADEHRQKIIMLLAKKKEGISVNMITEMMPLSRPAISHHLKVLKQVGIVDARKEGTENIYFLTLKDPIEKLKHFVNTIEGSYSD